MKSEPQGDPSTESIDERRSALLRATDIAALQRTLVAEGQPRLAAQLGAATLTEEQRARLAAQAAAIDWAELAALGHAAPHADPGEVRAPDVLTLEDRARRGPDLAALGAAAYRAGQVAVLMVAGGQGTRLGVDGPKGCFVITPYGKKSIYQLQAEKVAALARSYGRPIPLLIMTSPATDAETRAFFAAHNSFGFSGVRFFCQGQVPSLGADGQALLAGPDALLLNPDGHGGCFTALGRSGQLQRLVDEDCRFIVYIQVDNILAPVDDPILVGLAAAEQADVVTKVLEKATPDEKVGHLVRRGGRDAIVEYTELTRDDVRRRGPDGALLYRWGSPALHCFSVPFLADLWRRGQHLPLHRSQKPLRAYDPTLDTTHDVVGFKCERFIFDLLPAAPRSLGLAIDRSAEFAPIKNREGVDSPATALALADGLYARWLAGLGVTVALPEGAHLELSPRFAATEDELRRRWDGRCSELRAAAYLEEP